MTKQLQDVYIVEAVRSPVGKGRGVFANVRPDDLLVHVLKGLLARVPDMDHAKIDDVIIGCAMPEAEQGMNVARIGLLLAGLPETVPGVTVNRFCSSGLQTVAMAANAIAAGQADAIIAGGTESMSMVPLGGNKLSANLAYFEPNGDHTSISYGMGITAENVSEQWNVTREQQDEFSYESHQRALKGISSGEFDSEILPFNVKEHHPDLLTGKIVTKEFEVLHDQGPRPDTSLEALAKLPTVFKANGTVTAGNSSQISDGAGACLVVSEKMLKEYNLKPIARFCGFSVVGVPPEIMGIGPKEAIPKVLKSTGLSLQDIGWIELNEAFAAQSLAVIKDLDLDRAKVNPLGGAIALGHPLGATGAIRTATILHAMQRHQLKYGMVTMCIGTGMGAAGIFEAL